ncbi:MAG TPA: LamG-like jellyroll fold domain-containing protein [Sedimentisphaerales bacterium]|nr:LamG-like jellyroll fold domain-containing protein [Sedimentisphaerales bacterium]
MKERIVKLVVLAIAAGIGLPTNAAYAGLKGHWKLDDTSGTTVTDSGGNNYHGTLLGGLSFSQDSVSGVVGNALHLDGAKGGILIPESFMIPTDAFTIAFWFSPDSSLNSGSKQMNLVSGRINEGGGCPSFIFNKFGTGEIGFCVHVKEVYVDIRTRTNIWPAFTWHHIAATFDGKDFKVYVNGVLENATYLKGSHYGARMFYFGVNSSGQYGFDGRLDDIRFYNQALSTDEIAEFCPRIFLVILDTVREAETILKEKGPKKAISFIEKKIAEAEGWRNGSADNFSLLCRQELLDLYYLLARAKEAAGFAKEDVAAAYKVVVASGTLPLSNWRATLLWLYENTSEEEFGDIARLLIRNDSDYLGRLVSTAQPMVAEQKSKAVGFMEANLAAYIQWRQEHQDQAVTEKNMLPKMYAVLAEIREAAGLPKKDVADAYMNAFNCSGAELVEQRTAALIWLLENERAEEYTALTKPFVQSRNAADGFREVVRKVCQYFETKRDWAKFEQFLDTIFARAKYPFDWAVFVESCLSDRTNPWAKTYSEYLSSKPRSTFGWDWLAEKYMAEDNFKQAAERYKHVLSRCESADDKRIFEPGLCRCLFLAGEYSEAVARLESFIADNKAIDANLVKKAMLMRGQAFIQLGELDKATESFVSFMTAYPASEEIPDAAFFRGYCCILQGQSEKAAETLRSVARDFPESSYASRAQLCLSFLKNATK